MNIIKLKAGNKTIKVNVPCSKRFKYYESCLKDALSVFLVDFKQKKYDKSNFNLTAILESSLTVLAETLDEEAKYYLSRGLKKYLYKLTDNQYNDNTIDKYLKTLSPKNSAKLLNDFYCEQKIFDIKQFSEVGSDLMGKLTKQSTDYFKQVISNVAKDIELLGKAFFKGNPGRLINIKNLGGDKHKSGKQVLLLEFKSKQGVHKVVYKPNNLIMDALLLGDLTKLGDLDKNFENKQSAVEIFNEALGDKVAHFPKYLVLPKYTDNLKSDYGYIEYIEQKDSLTNGLKEKLIEGCKELDYSTLQTLPAISLTRERGQQDILETIYKKQLIKIKNKIKNGEESDFVTKTMDDVINYSEQAGMWYVFSKLFMLSDAHCGNMIYSKNLYMIDAEICFSEYGINENLFGSDFGSFRNDSKELTGISFFENAYGLMFNYPSYALLKPGKNRIFYLKDDELYSCEPIKKYFFTGVKSILSVLNDTSDELALLLSNKLLKEKAYIRLAPKDTLAYMKDIYDLKEQDFDAQLFEDIKNITKKNILIDLKENNIKIELPTECNKFYKSQMETLNVPYYAVKPFGRNLYSGDGEMVTYTYNQVKILGCFENAPYRLVRANRKALYSKEGKVITYIEKAKMLEYLEVEPIKLVTDNIQSITKTRGEKLSDIELPFAKFTRVDLTLNKQVAVTEIQQNDNEQPYCCPML